MARVLVADDLAPIRQTVRIALATAGWEILEARDGAEALQVARAAVPDVILLDVDMGPGPSGFAVCRTLRAEPATAHIPVVMLTAHVSERDRAMGLAAGATEYLTKPFGPLELIAVVRRLLAPG